jgi:MFS family permease
MSAASRAGRTPLPTAALNLVIGRGISSLGTTLTSFGLTVWFYRETGDYAIFALLNVAMTCASLLFAPVAGIMVDRWDRKRLLLATELFSILVVSALLAIDSLARPDAAAIALAVVLLALAAELRWSASATLVAQLVKPDQLGRINGLQQTFRGLNIMLGPVLAAVGLQWLGLSLLLWLDLLSYLIGMASLLGVASAGAAARLAQGQRSASWPDELTFGWRWITARPPLRRLLLFFMVMNVAVSIFAVTCTPFVLARASSATLGICLGMQGAGAFLGGVLLTRRRQRGDAEADLMRGTIGVGVSLLAWGLCQRSGALWAAAFLLGAASTLILAASQTVWQSQVPVTVQGKVFAVRSMLALALTPFAVLGSVPLASAVFAPALRHFTFAGALWGRAPGSNLGMMVSILGLAVLAYAAVLWTRGGLKLGQEQGVGRKQLPESIV